jgi:hypothetical protein
VTELRNTATDWGIDFGTVEMPVTLWYGDNDTNVPMANAHRFERVFPEATVRFTEDADYLGTLVTSVPEIFEQAGE